MENEFDWENVEAVFGSTRAVAVYLNAAWDVVIRQEAGALDDTDSVIFVPHDRLSRLIEALEALREKVS